MKSTIGRSVVLLLVFSAISYSKSYVPHQNPKPVQPVPAQTQISAERPESEPAKPEARVSAPGVAEPATSLSSPVVERSAAPSISSGAFEVAPQTYTATAYS